MVNLLWLIAVLLGVGGVVYLLKGEILLGIILIVLALAVGPGGWSIFR